MDRIISKLKEKKLIDIALVVIWMLIIFMFSSQVGNDSDLTSGNTIRGIVTLFDSNIPETNLETMVSKYQPFARKFAHFTLYVGIGFLLSNITSKYSDNKYKIIIYSLIIGVLYSISDEIHQIFVPGRAGKLFDVFIDSCGTITGIALFNLIHNIKQRIMVKKE